MTVCRLMRKMGEKKKIKWAQNGHRQKIAHFFHKSKNGQPQNKKKNVHKMGI